MALTRPLLQATLSMVAAAIHASKKTLQAAHIASRRRTQLHRALEHVRYHTWTHLKPAGTPCRCCAPPGLLAPGVHVRRSRRPVDGAKALRAVAQREGQRINGPARLESLMPGASRMKRPSSPLAPNASTLLASVSLIRTRMRSTWHAGRPRRRWRLLRRGRLSTSSQRRSSSLPTTPLLRTERLRSAAPPPMPPINGLCNSRLCRPHLRP
jgi:hypothetical protein